MRDSVSLVTQTGRGQLLAQVGTREEQTSV